MGGGGCLGVCLFLRCPEECHFLLNASICFYTHSKTAVSRNEAGKIQGQAGEEWVSSGVSIGSEACGQRFDGRREEMFTTAPSEFPPPHTLPSESQGLGEQSPTLGLSLKVT